MTRRTVLVPVLFVAAALAALGLGLTRTRTTWFDEAAHDAIAVEWVRTGQLGSIYHDSPDVTGPTPAPIFVSRPIALGLVYRIVGPGLLPSRLFGLVCHILACAVFYALCRRVGLSMLPAAVGAGALLVDRSMVWFVRSGRPDTWTLLTLLAMLACYVSVVGHDVQRRFRVSLAFAGGVLSAIASLSHAYALPAVALTNVVFLPVFARTHRLALLAAVSGLSLVGAAYAPYVVTHSDAWMVRFRSNAAFLTEHGSGGFRFGTWLFGELTRWSTGTFLHLPRWVATALALTAFARKRTWPPAVRFACAWIVLHAVFLTAFVPKGTWYQVGYVAPAPAFLLALFLGGARVRRSTAISHLAHRLAAWELMLGLLLATPYAVVSLLQWNVRSHRDVRDELAALVPAGSRVACDFGAYFACVEAGHDARAYEFRRRGAPRSPELEGAYRSRFLDGGFDALVLEHGRPRIEVEKAVASGRLLPLGTIGRPKEALPFVRDRALHFDVFGIRAVSAPPGP